ncbi:MAG: hypothetical protein WC356_04600 [Candidatus Micrarchaeia archaeon]|jgi:hypothetical protein
MNKHTATPWKVSSVFVNNAPNETHITTGKWGQPSIAVVDNEANAAYIVRCVNSHEALVEACKVSLENHEIGEYESQMQGKPRYCEVLEILRAALKLAGEG